MSKKQKAIPARKKKKVKTNVSVRAELRREFRSLESKLTEKFLAVIADVKLTFEGVREKQHSLEEKLDTIQREFEENVTRVADVVVANMNEGNKQPTTERSSGSRKSPAGQIADQGIRGLRLPGNFES